MWLELMERDGEREIETGRSGNSADPLTCSDVKQFTSKAWRLKFNKMMPQSNSNKPQVTEVLTGVITKTHSEKFHMQTRYKCCY